jgi:hypothetical protein
MPLSALISVQGHVAFQGYNKEKEKQMINIAGRCDSGYPLDKKGRIISPKSKKKIIIIGAGLAGTIAYNALRSYDPIVIESKPPTPKIKTHPAIMRLRDPQIAKYIGTDCSKIKVTKGIYFDDFPQTSSDIQLNNLYSRKVYGSLGNRSLNDLGEQERWLIDGYRPPDNIIWNRKVSSIQNGIVNCQNRDNPGTSIEKHKYDICVSTIPMPAMFNIVGTPKDVLDSTEFDCNPVYVLRLKLNIPSNIHQTIYYPEPTTSIYRATIQNQTMIIESMDDESYPFNVGEWKAELKMICRSFGIEINNIDRSLDYCWKKIPIGKIKPIDEDKRLHYIMWLTDKHNIFSFGRFSVWRPLRTDHLISDIEKIKRIIKAGDIRSRYKSRI